LYSDWTDAETALVLLLDDDALLAELDELLVLVLLLVVTPVERLPRMLMMGSVRL